MTRELITVTLQDGSTISRIEFIRTRTLNGQSVSEIHKELKELGHEVLMPTIWQAAHKFADKHGIEVKRAKQNKLVRLSLTQAQASMLIELINDSSTTEELKSVVETLTTAAVTTNGE